MSLVFYDTETTGIDTSFDQILQFAAIRTDADLNELDRIEVRCRLLPHIVPAIGALHVTRVSLSHLTDQSLPSHYEMIRAVRAKLVEWSPALFIGWNSLRFDEHLLRQALYKTLHPPYLTNTNGSSRTDAMRIVQACSIMAPGALRFPDDGFGGPVFKLAEMAPANGFSHENAHEAMADVEATIFLCRRLMEKAPEVWSNFMRFSTKAAVMDFIQEEQVYGLADFYNGRAYSWAVTTLGQNEENSAEWYAYNLGIRPELLESLSDDDLILRLAQSPKPVRKIKANGAPMLFTLDEAPDICRDKYLGLEELTRRADLVKPGSKLAERLIAARVAGQEEWAPNLHVEQQIYDGFFEQGDETLMGRFHEVAWEERPRLVARFTDQRLRTLGLRLIHEERPHLLEDSVRLEHDLERARRILGHGENTPWRTLGQAFAEFQLFGGIEESERLKLIEHLRHLREREAQANAKLREVSTGNS